MAANSVPRFIERPRTWMVQVSAANTALDGSGSLATLLVAGPNGSRVDLFALRAADEVKQNTVRFFLFTSAGTGHLWQELTVSASSGALPGQAVYNAEFAPVESLQLPADWEIRCSIHTSDLINVFATGGDY